MVRQQVRRGTRAPAHSLKKKRVSVCVRSRDVRVCVVCIKNIAPPEQRLASRWKPLILIYCSFLLKNMAFFFGAAVNKHQKVNLICESAAA